ncbi:hypothetical protein [Flavobacterium sp.]|uniref:hypothetical protein n=1 Tax=Flavobacterium sp. TaxID=239 RepID=UPI001227EA87|nr:hypothetical protein [Flavobacterium sp.]RZJ71383.1 MAG: hypothetical protein EOO49_09990 [Flavobacterium sp.]
MKSLVAAILLFCVGFAKAQNIYPTKFAGCNTDHFTIESKVESAKIEQSELIKVVSEAIGSEKMAKIEGILMLQIIVGKDGKSCLISLDNKTTIPTEELKIKDMIDSKLVWKVAPEKLSTMISLRFSSGKIKEIKRYGLHGDLGFHELKK